MPAVRCSSGPCDPIVHLRLPAISRRPSGLRKTTITLNSLAHRTTWLRSDLSCTSNFNYLKNAQRLFSCRPYVARPGLATRSCIFGFLPSVTTFEGDSFRHPFLVSLRFPFPESPSWLLCSYLERSGCNQSDNESIFQSKHIPSTFLPLRALSLAREDFLRKLSGTCEPFNLRPFCYNIQKNTWHLLVVRPALDYSLPA